MGGADGQGEAGGMRELGGARGRAGAVSLRHREGRLEEGTECPADFGLRPMD